MKASHILEQYDPVVFEMFRADPGHAPQSLRDDIEAAIIEKRREEEMSRREAILAKKLRRYRSESRMDVVEYKLACSFVPVPKPDEKIKETHIERVFRETANKHQCCIKDIKGVRRWKHLVKARQEICYRLRTETNLSYPAIGQKLGNRDHTTVLHGAKKHAKDTGKKIPD